MIDVGSTVQATVRKVTANLVVTKRIELSQAARDNKPGLVCNIIAEGLVKSMNWCKLGDVYEDGSITWLN